MIETIKGWLGEKETTFIMWAFLDKAIYHRIDNVIVPSENGTTQIDHVLVSIYGIFVIETKNLKGWIFGTRDADKWTQVIFGQKNHFQNPIKQNYRHTKCLSEYLYLDHDFFRPVVFFIGECEFKTDIPANIINTGLTGYIKSFKNPVLTDQQISQIETALRSLKNDVSLTRRSHLGSLKERHESTTVCPRCGAQLVRRTAKRGPFIGEVFLGCGNFPRCRFMRFKKD
jgi:restriction system protein